MNRMELEQRSEECMDIDQGNVTVAMKSSASLGELSAHILRTVEPEPKLHTAKITS